MRTLSDIVQKLPTSAEAGLSAEGVALSRKEFGENRLTPLPREPLWKKFLEKFDEPIIKILLAAALLSMVVDLFKGKAYIVGGLAVGLLVVGLIAAYATKRASLGSLAPVCPGAAHLLPRPCYPPATSSSRAWR